jgi:hypothetical protein
VALQSTDVNASGFNAAVRDLWLSKNSMPLFTQRSPFLGALMMRGRIQKAGYGTNMREMLTVPVTTGPQLVGVANAYADFSPQPMTGYTTAEYILSEYYFNLSWQDYDMKRANGPVEMVQWQESHFINAHKRSYNKILADLWAAPENPLSAGDRTQVASIQTFINGGTTAATDGGAQPPAQASQSATPFVMTSGATAVTTVGTIPRAAAGAAYWCPGLLNPGLTALTVLVLNDVYEEAFQEGDEPNYIAVPSNLFSKLQNLLTVGGSNGGQVYGESKLAKFGFSTLRFRNADIVVDRRVPTSGFLSGTTTALGAQMYCMNLNYITLRMDGKKPTFEEVSTNKPIHEEKGAWNMALTSKHLGNVHSRHLNLSQ